VKLSTTYNILTGDTLESISKKVFGSEIHADHIFNANPGLTKTLIPGTSIVIPNLPDYPGDLPKLLGVSGTTDVEIYIDGSRFEFWESLTITRSLDSIDSFSFSAPFEFDSPGFRNLFVPFTYKPILIYVGSDLILKGIVISIRPNLDSRSSTIEVTGYSLPGILNDCNMPYQPNKFEFLNVNLLDIAKALSKPFGLSVNASVNVGAVFPTVKIKPTQKIYNFLSDLAKKRNLILSNNLEGELIFLQSGETGNPVANLEVGKGVVTAISADFNEQEYYSHLTGITFVDTDIPGGQYTEKNPFLLNRIRPITFTAKDTDTANIKTTVNAKTGRMFANMLTYSISVASWIDTNRKLWEPNTTISLLAPQVFVYNKYDFIVRSVEFTKDANSETAIIELIPPGGFSGKIPEKLPWDS
jgi:prophage tail gpP-like protein/phage tail protein X